MFNAPDIVFNIPDIKQIYDVNDEQSDALDAATAALDDNIFLDTMDKATVERWEAMLKLSSHPGDTLDERRFRVKTKATERLPYSYRVLLNKLNTLCPDGYTLSISDDRTSAEIKIALKSKRMITDVQELIEDILPLNMYYTVSILWNQYRVFTGMTYGQLKKKTFKELREEVTE